MLFDTSLSRGRPKDALAFIVEILHASTEYSVIGTGLDGTILLWNEGARCLSGYEPEEVLGKPHRRLSIHRKTSPPAAVTQGALRECKWEGLLAWVCKNGQRFLAPAVVTVPLNAAGQRTG